MSMSQIPFQITNRLQNVEEMTPISRLYKHINPFVPGCPQPLIDQQIISTLRHFFDQTQCFKYICHKMTMIINQTGYTISDYPQGYWPERIDSMKMYLNDEDRQGSQLWPGYDFTGMVNPLGFVLSTIPTATRNKALEPIIVLLPEFNATVMPVDIYNRFFDPISDGVKARCYAMPKTSWSDPQQAVVNQQSYEEGVNNARTRVARKFINTPLIAQPGSRFA